MFYTLAALKKKPAHELKSLWWAAEFPFDRATCNGCVTTHGQESSGCDDHKHAKFWKDAASVWLNDGKSIKRNLAKIWALRLKYRKFYDDNPPQLSKIGTKTTKRRRAL